MQIIILGNGFDLANNLPTKYTDFFEAFLSRYEEIFWKIKDVLEWAKKNTL